MSSFSLSSDLSPAIDLFVQKNTHYFEDVRQNNQASSATQHLASGDAPAHSSGNGAGMQKPKIAFIDDEERILRSLKMQFRQTHDVFVTTDPQEFIEYVKANQVLVAISDQRMPTVQGTEVLKQVKEVSPQSLRILLTGYADLNAVRESVNEGEIFRYITKPWQNDEIKDIIQQATDIALRTAHVAHLPDVNLDTVEKWVLVLDEDPAVYQHMKAHFEPAYHVRWAANLEDAVTLLNQHPFGVAITDITLDGDNIAPVIYALKHRYPELMVLMLTEFKDAHMMIDLINKGQIYRCLPRPTNTAMLGISLDRAFKHHYKMRQNPDLSVRHQVAEVAEHEQVSLTSRIKGFFSGLKRFGRS